MAAGNNDIDCSIGISPKSIKSCTIRYTGRKYFTTVIVTGYETTLEKLQQTFPDENIQVCQEDNIEYYKVISEGDLQFFAYRNDGLKGKAYYWENGHWNGYRTLESAEVSILPVVNDEDENCIQIPSTSQEAKDDRLK